MRVCLVVLYVAVLWTNFVHQYHCKSASFPKAEAFLARFDDKDVETAIDQMQPCRGAKCECTDRELKTRFYTTVGHVVSYCRMKEMYDGLYNHMEGMYLELYEHTSDKESDTDSHDAGMSPRDDDVDQHDAVCEMMREIGYKYQEGDFGDEISSCCDYKERIATFQCLHVYMTQAELRVAESRYTDFVENAYVSKAEIVEELETQMEDACDAIFGSMDGLVEGIERHLAGQQGGTAGVSSHHDQGDGEEEEGLTADNIFGWRDKADRTGKGGKIDREGTKKGGKKSKEGKVRKKGGKKNKASNPSEDGAEGEEDGAAAVNKLDRVGKAGRKSGSGRKTGEDRMTKGDKKNKDGKKEKSGKKGGKKNKAIDSSDGGDDVPTLGSNRKTKNHKSRPTDDELAEHAEYYNTFFNDLTHKRGVMETSGDPDINTLNTESLIDKLIERLRQH